SIVALMLAAAKTTAMALTVIRLYPDYILRPVIRDSLVSHAKACKENFRTHYPIFGFVIVITITAVTISAMANSVRGVMGSPATAQPRNTATAGFTYA